MKYDWLKKLFADQNLREPHPERMDSAHIRKAIAFIESAGFEKAAHIELFGAFLTCYGDYPDIRMTDEDLRKALKDFADGWRHAEDE